MSNSKSFSSFGLHNLRKGSIVAFIGIDGSGKSTFSQILANYIARKGFKVRVLYSGNHGIHLAKSYNFYLSLPLDIIRNRFLPKGYLNSHRESKLSSFLSLMSKFLLFLNYLLIVIPCLWFCEKLGYIIIADRYVYDYIVNTIKDGTYSSVLTRLLLRFTPVPLATLVFDVQPEVAYLRKNGEKSLKDLEVLHSLYHKILRIIKAKRIDSTSSFDEILVKVVDYLENANPSLDASLQSIEFGLDQISQ